MTPDNTRTGSRTGRAIATI